MQSAVSLPAGYEKRWYGLFFIGIALTVISLDNTILNVAIPAISRSLGATASDLQWIVDAYVLVFAALLLTMGSVGDRIGRKRSLLTGLALFGIGSVGAAVSSTTGMLIAARAFLGIGGAMIMPATLSILTATFPREERAQAIGIWAALFGLGVGLGPVLGGLLVQTFSWNAVFLINVPVVIIAIAGGAIYLGESKDENAPKPDIPGVILSIIGLFALVYGIIEAGLHGWTGANVLAAFGVALVFIGAFVWWEVRTPNAMLPMRFFRNPSFTGANLTLTLFAFGMFGSMFFMSQYFQTAQAIPAFEAGLRVVPMALTLTIMSTRAPKIAARIGQKRAVMLGAILAATGMFYMSQVFHVETPYWQILIGQLILAVGLGTAFSPATTMVMNSVPLAKAGVGSAMNDTTRQLGGALGVALLGTVATNAYLSGIEPLTAQLEGISVEAANVVRESIQAAHVLAANAELPAALREAIINTTSTAFVNGMNMAMLIGSVAMLGAFLLALVVLPAHAKRLELPTEEVPAPAPAGD